MEQPPGFVDPAHPSFVCRLHKSIYGLKQSPCAWFLKLSSCLLDWGFVSSKTDHPCFIFVSFLIL